MNVSYYELLEVRDDASQEVIAMAYKALCRKYHPDVYRGPKDVATELMQRINEAYETLSDPDRRMKYDLLLKYSRNNEQYSESKSDTRQKDYGHDAGNSTGHSESGKKSAKKTALFAVLLVLIVGVVYLIGITPEQNMNSTEPSQIISSDCVDETFNAILKSSPFESKQALVSAIQNSPDFNGVGSFRILEYYAVHNMGLRSYDGYRAVRKDATMNDYLEYIRINV